MKRHVSTSLLAAAIALLLAAPIASAKLFEFSHSNHKSATVNFLYAAKIGNGPEIQPGNYKITLMDDSTSPKVGFYQNGKLVAETSARLVSEPNKSQQTEIYYNTQGQDSHVVTEVEVSGWTQKVVFSNPNVSKSANSGT
jgi:hypothetical protein